MIIYKITNIINNKIYIGLTKKLIQERFLEHIKVSKYKKSYIHSAINKYGNENFIIEQIDKCSSLKQLKKKEIFWIKELNSKVPNGYNMTDGGDGLLNPSNEIREKMSVAKKGKLHSKEHQKKLNESMKKFYALTSEDYRKKLYGRSGENHPLFGKHHSEKSKQKMSETAKNMSKETKEKIRLSRIGKKATIETKLKMSESHKKFYENKSKDDIKKICGRSGINNAMFGKTHSLEARKKISEKSKGNKNCVGRICSEETRKKISDSHKKRYIIAHN